MLPPVIQRPGRSAARPAQERGITLVLVAVAISTIIAMATLSIDVGTLYQASAEAQRAADAAALAAAKALSSSGMTGDPANSSLTWPATCANATQVAQAVANQNKVGGAVPSGVSVTFSARDGTDCTAAAASGFGVNPMVTVKVTQSSLSTYFSRIWGRTGSTVSATATAEAFNPSNSKNYASVGELVPVQPRCVKPWLVPNLDPVHPTLCTNTTTPPCTPFVDPTTGSIQTQGIRPVGPTGVIGERFLLLSDCTSAGACTLLSPSPQANSTPPNPNLEYVPGETLYPSAAVPSGCSSSSTYAQAIAGCDQSTQYQCGKAVQNNVDLTGTNTAADTTEGTRCLIRQDRLTGVAPSGQDVLLPYRAPTPFYPFQIEVGSNNPLLGSGAGNNDHITSSTSIVSLPIYDTSTSPSFTSGTKLAVTIVGFLQVFINHVDATGNMRVTVMNVSGCGNAASNPKFLTGTSSVPVRLVTPP